MALSCEEGFLLSAGSGGRRKEVEVGAGDCASVTGEFRACPVQACEDVLCFEEVSPVAEDDWVALGDTVGVTVEKAEKSRFKEGLEEGGDGKLGELHFGTVRDV